ncbi:MAG TPA: dihydropyrimidinase [Myxococcales bacterium]|jgi:dihydropyrimidinase|nr:dihydropyrimidinase [Myxococcales bacterium]
MRTLIEHGTLVSPADTFEADLLIEGEKIQAIGKDLGKAFAGADVRIDARGKYVIPGGIDVHTHLDMPFGGTNSADDFESGTTAAAFGGTTTLVDFAIQPQGGGSLKEGLAQWHAKAEGKAVVDYGFHMIVREVNKSSLAEMDDLVKREGVTSFKLFTAYPGVFYVDDAQIFRALRKTGENGGLICMHAENGPVIDVIIEEAKARGETAPAWHALTRPPRLEGEASHRVLALAEVAKVPIYIVHLSAAEALEQVRMARDRGVRAYAETCPQYLFLDHRNYEEPGFEGSKYVMSPPLRAPGNEQALWRGLQLDDLQCVSTDHCPFCMKEKRMGEGDFSKIPNGAPGVETRLYLTFEGVRSGRISINRWVQLNSAAPAKLFGLYGRKGTLAPGADADVVVWDPGKRHTLSAKTHHMRVDYNPYEGREVVGAPTHVLSRGAVIVENGKFLGRKGAGRFLKRGLTLA